MPPRVKKSNEDEQRQPEKPLSHHKNRRNIPLKRKGDLEKTGSRREALSTDEACMR